MTDAEYEELQYAAIAAGYKPVRLTDDCKAFLLEGVQKPWNPRKDKGDALRLAVRLGIDVQQFVVAGFCEAWRHPHTACAESFGEDRYAATRRAIVRMAAEIGKQMGGSDV